MQTVILLGAPGAGKGTIAELLVEQVGFTHVSTGDMLRDAIKKETPMGLEASAYMQRGDLVPDTVVAGIVADRLKEGNESSKFLLDGFPRTLEQADLLAKSLEELGESVSAVFLLELPVDIIVDRLTGRRICKNCGTGFHIRNIPPKVEGVCDKCRGPLYQRPDDTEATIRNRLEVFEKQTSALINYYDQKNLLIRIDSAGDRNATADTIVAKLSSTTG
ncbi:MAG: adenylate kinase [Lentisphaerae bacterium]|nr:adenylate kinase [Lentisphaerota bacterium]